MLAALASFLDARSHRGRWLLRIDDLDQARIALGSAQLIEQQLVSLGLQWDGPIQYQSRHQGEYQAALATLRQQGLLFACRCSRRLLRKAAAGSDLGVCAGRCRQQLTSDPPIAWRCELAALQVDYFVDRFQGEVRNTDLVSDVTVQRRDGVFAYQLAVLVDDSLAGITEVVRGADLLTSTFGQLALAKGLKLTAPRYAHAPLLTAANGAKLSKSAASAQVLATRAPSAELVEVLTLLRQQPPKDLERLQVRDIIDWAVRHWQPAAFTGLAAIPAPIAAN